MQPMGFSIGVLASALAVAASALVSSPAATADPARAAAAISSDMGQQLSVVRCYTDWAYVTMGGPGDATSLVQRVNGVWARYTGFPSSICRSQAASAGVPQAELSSFRPC